MRLFKPGDRVREKTGGPIMIVQRYAREYSPLLGWHESNHEVECSWYEHEYKSKVIHQHSLIKVSDQKSVASRNPVQLQKM